MDVGAAPARSARAGAHDAPWFPWALMAPTLIVLLILGVFPFLYSLYLASTNIILSKPYLETEFVGLYQYHELVQDRRFLNALKVTAIFTFFAVFIEFWAGLGLALLFRRRIRGKAFFRLAILLPMVLPPVVVGLTWRYLLYPHSGLVTYYSTLLFGFFGLPAPQFLSSPDAALQTLIMIDVWQWTPFMFLILHAGLASLPPEPYEAAEIDGASSWRVFWTITLPMLKPSIMIALVIRTMDAFRTYDTIAVLTKGGPGNATETLNILLTNIGFGFFNISKAAALSFIILVIIITLSFLFIRVFAKKQLDEA
ncbi:sugar ABC transporter permease [Chelativorans sp.]|uniref:carbohydrate ABC transporter permease n=1 Tax=Chelativorans sp. TaxID=2203393 RepID=UPI0028119A8F|nr:sugar ABC transporter permease [Chelativorans sp.]